MGKTIPISLPEGIDIDALEVKDRMYRYKGGTAKTFFLKSKSDRLKALLYFDEKTARNYELRYAVNQRSPFKELQDEHVIIDHVMFTDGWLRVPKTNMVLQYFLALHPGNGRVFEEVDRSKDAEDELNEFEARDKASDLARSICRDIDLAESLYVELFKKEPKKLTSTEIKRDIRAFAYRNPLKFLSSAEGFGSDSSVAVNSFFKDNLLGLRNNETQIFFNLPSNKKKMIDVLDGETPVEAAIKFFETDEGLEAFREIERVQATK